MQTFEDSEFGTVKIRRLKNTRNIRMRFEPGGNLSVCAPRLTPVIFIKQTLNNSRESLRKLRQSEKSTTYHDGQSISKNHRIAVVKTNLQNKPSVKVIRQSIIVYLPSDYEIQDASVQRLIKSQVAKVLRVEAKAYLPTRLRKLSKLDDFHYERVRFSHASSRWGSCSSAGTISLNIALMKLPDELIDYVLIHELSHTRHMNHSKNFWKLVEKHDPIYKIHRKLLKRETPSV